MLRKFRAERRDDWCGSFTNGASDEEEDDVGAAARAADEHDNSKPYSETPKHPLNLSEERNSQRHEPVEQVLPSHRRNEKTNRTQIT